MLDRGDGGVGVKGLGSGFIGASSRLMSWPPAVYINTEGF